MKVKIVTSFNKRIFDEYANKSLQTWVDNIGLDVGSEIEVWINGPFPTSVREPSGAQSAGLPKQTFNGTPFKYKLLDTQSEGWQFFYETFHGFPRPQTPKGQEYIFNFLPFSCKVYAMAEAAQKIRDEKLEFERLVWIDADVVFKKTFSDKDILSLSGEYSLAWLDRNRPWAHGETGFMISRTDEDNLDLFLSVANVYGSGALFYHAQWHDAFIYTSQIRFKEFTDPNYKVLNLNMDTKNEHDQGLHPFRTSRLDEFMDHWKGDRKGNIK